jgi:hypothetical protein
MRASLAVADLEDNKKYLMGNTGYALVKSKTADIYQLKLEHNKAVVNTVWVPNEDIPEDVNIIPFPMNPLYVKQGTLDGKFKGEYDPHYQGNTSKQRSYFKPKEAYKLKKRIEREQMELEQLYQQFDVADTNNAYVAAATVSGISQMLGVIPHYMSMAILNVLNQAMGAVQHADNE